MRAPGTPATITPMDEREIHVRLRVEEIREEFALRDAEQRMAGEARPMERKLKELEEHEMAAEQEIAREWRHEHWGREPERPPAWEATPDAEVKRR